MPISVECPGCQKRLKAKDELIGKRVKCPACGSPVTIAAAKPVPAPAPVPEPLPSPPDPVRLGDTPVPRKKRRPESEDERQRDDDQEREDDREREDEPERERTRNRKREREREDDDERDRRRNRGDYDDRGRRPSRDTLKGVSPHYRVSLSRWLAVALPHYKAVSGPAIGYMFLFSFVIALWWVVSVVALTAIASISRVGAIVAAPFVVLPFIAVVPALAMGFHVVCQKQIKEEQWGFGTFFSGFNWMWRLVGRALLLTLVEVAAAIPVVGLMAIGGAIGSPPPVVVGFLCASALGCALVGFYVLFRLTIFSHLLMIDRDCGVIDSLRGSWILTRGHFWSLFGISLATMLILNGFTLAAVGISVLFPKLLLFVSVPLLAIGAVVQFLAFPAVLLVLNAGYLLVAGKEALPEQQPNSERVEKRPASILGWLPVGAVSAAVVLVAVGLMLWEMSNRERMERVKAEHQQQSLQQAERAKQEEARRLAVVEQDAKELVGFFREGGYWSMELSDRNADPATVGPDGPGGPPPGAPMGIGLPGGMEPARRKVRVLVLGPRGMLTANKPVKLGIPLEPNAGWVEKSRRLGDLPFGEFYIRDFFYRHFAEAMTTGEVEAALVEAELEFPRHGGPGAPAGSGLTGMGPPDGPGAAPGAPQGGEGITPASPFHGVTVPLDKAERLTREKFQKLIEKHYGPSDR